MMSFSLPAFGALAVLLAATVSTSGPEAATDAPAVVVPVTEALQLGPLPLALPAFHDSAVNGATLDDVFGVPSLDPAGLWPRENDQVVLPVGGTAAWTRVAAAAGTFALAAGSDGPREAWLAANLDAARWQKAALRITAPETVKLAAWLDGAPVALKASGDVREGELTLPTGRHVLLVRSAAAGDDPPGSWRLAPALTLASGLPASALRVAATMPRTTDIRLVLDAPRIAAAAISPDGALVALQIGAYSPAGKRERWVEVRRVADGTTVTTWPAVGEVQDLQWLPQGRRLSYAVGADGKSDLWRLDLATGQAERLLRGIERLGAHRWAPDATFVVYEVGIESKDDPRKVKRVANPADRQPSWRERSYLMMAGVPDGVARRLTAGPLSPGGWKIAPDGKHVLFFREDQDLTARPYFAKTLHEVDLTTLAVTDVLTDRWIEDATYAPDGSTRLLLRGSPSAFGNLGLTLPAGVQPNDYGGQLYLYDRARQQAAPLTRDLIPDVNQCWWSAADGKIYALCTDAIYARVYRRDPRDGAAWQLVPAGEGEIDAFDLARTAPIAIARGTSATQPNRLHAIDLEKNTSRLLLDPGRDAWDGVVFGKWEPWVAALPGGEKLDGHMYYPVDFDPTRTYPLIVFYYGGTSPVGVDFGSRYPREVWTANGYVVYVPEPSGATGYGQEFAARHVNDWGQLTAREVIEGTRAFLAAHPFVDPARVGCIGASYGGFLTEYLLTQTDMFACGISHAGISSISTYWGEGLWGYDYGARALANAFPWQDRDLYIEQSPLFHADKIHTPLLLLHGADDTNVPVGESDQLFTALKLLGRDVEYVQVLGQDHWILDHDQRIVWNDTILAYFAKHLKDEPESWEAMYPAP